MVKNTHKSKEKCHIIISLPIPLHHPFSSEPFHRQFPFPSPSPWHLGPLHINRILISTLPSYVLVSLSLCIYLIPSYTYFLSSSLPSFFPYNQTISPNSHFTPLWYSYHFHISLFPNFSQILRDWSHTFLSNTSTLQSTHIWSIHYYMDKFFPDHP